MKLKRFKDKYSKKTSKKHPKQKKLVDVKWIITITLCAFFISFIFSFVSDTIISNVSALIGTLILLLVIGIGVLFDMIGIAVTVADIKTFNSMAAKNVKGSKVAVKFIKNSEKVASFCNDVIGDICGIISGALATTISVLISTKYSTNLLITTLIITSLAASLTIGGKAIGKSTAINKSNVILYKFCEVVYLFYK